MIQYKILNIPIPDSDEETEKLNRFLSSVKVIAIEKTLACYEKRSYWSFAVEYYKTGPYQDKKAEKVDYKEVLSAEDFALYSQLRDLRKELAEKENIPVYALFTNQQMAQMVTSKVKSLSALRKIEGIGEKKAGKYGDPFLEKLKEIFADS